MISFSRYLSEQIAYHGTVHNFSQFMVPKENYMLDRELGIHLAKDPNIAHSFIELRTNGRLDGYKDNGRIIKGTIPEDHEFYEIPQPMYPHAVDTDWPLSKKVKTDQAAIETEIAVHGFANNHDLLVKHLKTARGMDESEAQNTALHINSNQTEARKFFNNYGGRPFDQKDRGILVKAAIKKWQSLGYKGVRYINTSPMETMNATDFTSYVVFDPNDIK